MWLPTIGEEFKDRDALEKKLRRSGWEFEGGGSSLRDGQIIGQDVEVISTHLGLRLVIDLIPDNGQVRVECLKRTLLGVPSAEEAAEEAVASFIDNLPDTVGRGMWVNNKYLRHPHLPHPCDTLNYCPYGQLVEVYPLHAWYGDAKKAAKAEGKRLREYLKGHPEITARDCGLYGHECPVHYLAEIDKEAKEALETP